MKINAIDIITMAIDSFAEVAAGIPELAGLTTNKSRLCDIERCASRLDELIELTHAESFTADVNPLTKELQCQVECPLYRFDEYTPDLISAFYDINLIADDWSASYYMEHNNQMLMFIFDRVFDQSHGAQ